MAKILKFWHQYSPLFHLLGLVLTMAFTAGIVYAGASKYESRIVALENAQAKQEKSITRMDYNIQIIADRLGVKPLRGQGREEE